MYFQKVKGDETVKPKQKKTDAKKTTTTKKTTTSTQNGGLKPSTGNTQTNRTNSARTNTVNSTRNEGGYHPPIVGIDPSSDTLEYYWVRKGLDKNDK